MKISIICNERIPNSLQTPQVDRRFHSTFLSELARSPSAEFHRSLRIQRNKISSQAHKISVVGPAGQPSSLFLSPNDPRLSHVSLDQNILPQHPLQTTATKDVQDQSPQQPATPNNNPPSSLQQQVASITVEIADNIPQPNFNSHNTSRQPLENTPSQLLENTSRQQHETKSHKTSRQPHKTDNQPALQLSRPTHQCSENRSNIPGGVSQPSTAMEPIQNEHGGNVSSPRNGMFHRETPREAISGIVQESNGKPSDHQQHQPAPHRYRNKKRTIHYFTVQYSTIQYITVQHIIVQYCILEYCTV